MSHRPIDLATLLTTAGVKMPLKAVVALQASKPLCYDDVWTFDSDDDVHVCVTWKALRSDRDRALYMALSSLSHNAYDSDSARGHCRIFVMRKAGDHPALRRNPTFGEIVVSDEQWRPPGVYRVEREKRRVPYGLLIWVIRGEMFVLGHFEGERHGEWWYSRGVHALRGRDEGDFGKSYITQLVFEVDGLDPTQFDLHTLGMYGHLVLEQMLPRYQQLIRQQPVHKPSRMPRRKTVRGVSY